jgi:hypothetical protein
MKLPPELDKYPHRPLNDYQYALLPLHFCLLFTILIMVWYVDIGRVFE